MTSHPHNAQKRFAPVRPLLNQPPLNIENLPTRIQNGDCTVLPPKFCPPMSLPPICPPTACQPSPCSPYCIPQPSCLPSCYFPSPCSPCTPMPSPMCCPPPCPPVIVCPPPCTPYSCNPCTPCMPTPPPPPCCPPPPCPPPPCQPCVPKTGCGGNNCCCSSPKQIVCIPRRAQAQPMMVGCGNGDSQAVRKVVNKSHDSRIKPGINDQQASYNNCNFYLTEVPKALRSNFGLNSSPTDEDEECMEEVKMRDMEECTSEKDEDGCEDLINIAAGDDQVVPPPVGYPGSHRSPWGAGAFPGLAKGDGYEIGHLKSTEIGRSGRGGGANGGRRFSKGSSGDYGSGRGMSGSGRSDEKNSRNKTGRTETRGHNPHSAVGGGNSHGASKNSNVGKGNHYARIKTANIGGGNRYGIGKSPNAVRTDDYHGKGRHPNSVEGGGHYGRNQSRNHAAKNGHDDPFGRGTRNGPGGNGNARSNNSTGKSGRNKQSHPNKPPTDSKHHGSGAASKKFSKASGYRPYVYSNDELTKKSEAYLPENYDEPPPHELDPSIYLSRAPVTSYSTYNRSGDDFGLTGSRTRTQATMKPSCSTIPSTRHAHTSTQQHSPSVRTTATSAPSSNLNTTAVGVGTSRTILQANRSAKTTTVPSFNYNKTAGVGTSRSMIQMHTGNGTTAPPSSNFSTANFGASGSQIHGSKSATTRPHSEPNLRRYSEDDEGNLVPSASYRSTQLTSLQELGRSDKPSEYHLPQKPIRSYHKAATSSRNPENNFKDTGNSKYNKRPFDPCHPPKTCLKYHTRRLHRLCSVTNQHTKRLSDIHKPIFHFKAPPCPIRETVASILRKNPPGKFKWNEQRIPAYHDYCMTDRYPDTNRYPLLTREFAQNSPGQEEYDESQHALASTNGEMRGAKRKQHHR